MEGIGQAKRQEEVGKEEGSEIQGHFLSTPWDGPVKMKKGNNWSQPKGGRGGGGNRTIKVLTPWVVPFGFLKGLWGDLTQKQVRRLGKNTNFRAEMGPGGKRL